MGIFGSRKQDVQDDGELRALAQELRLEFRRAGKNHAELRGVIEGHRIEAVMHTGGTAIEVRFDSGLEKLSIRSRAMNLRTNLVDHLTGDPSFDASYRLLLRKDRSPQEALAYLTPERKETIKALGAAFALREVEEDEIDLRLDGTPSAAELKQAIELCLLAARALEKSAPLQDR